MGEVITAFTSWPSLLLVIFIFGFAPGFALRLLLKIYPLDDPRRRELLSELYAVPRLERPFWVAEQLETALLEGIPLRARYVKHKRGQQQIERAIEILRRQMTPWSSPSSPLLLYARAADSISSVPRLAILGAPATGKTTLARLLVGQMFASTTGQQWVPVWMDMRRWDPCTTSCRTFMVHELKRRWGVPRTLARKLIEDGRVLAVFDGLDEVKAQYRAPAISALNRHWRERPMIITSRQEEFAALSGLIDAATIPRIDLSPMPLLRDEEPLGGLGQE
ncbi:NACHT domain-containing protein [Streptomyces sp. NBC_01455]|uniref:NACHT domain-containing protein n=1 Tax=Streptomyces sp. NBC_01455 TaxID=2903874 RepID=UPI002E3543F6|nr:NACHT domain-containing protein [Streptomyces sp. NBC_01455]